MQLKEARNSQIPTQVKKKKESFRSQHKITSRLECALQGIHPKYKMAL